MNFSVAQKYIAKLYFKDKKLLIVCINTRETVSHR